MNFYKTGRKILCGLPHGGDLLGEIEKLARREGVKTGSVTVIGAVQAARVGYYDQETHDYLETAFEEPLEICSCLGNISLKEGEVFVHAHVALASRDGRVIGGHLAAGCKIFAAECLLEELAGEELERLPDRETGLSLWPARR